MNALGRIDTEAKRGGVEPLDKNQPNTHTHKKPTLFGAWTVMEMMKLEFVGCWGNMLLVCVLN